MHDVYDGNARSCYWVSFDDLGTLTNSSYVRRFGREREVNDRETDEDYPSEWLFDGRIGVVSTDDLQESYRLCQGVDWSNEAI